MQKIQVFLRDDQKVALKALAVRSGKKQSDLIRYSIDKYLEDSANEEKNWRQAAKHIAGLWRGRDDLDELDFRGSIRRRFDGRS